MMTSDEARERVIDGINYAAYRETNFSLYDADKNRLFGSEHYNSGRIIVRPSPWPKGDFEEKMATLLCWANILNKSDSTFSEVQQILAEEDSTLGRIIRRAKTPRVEGNALFSTDDGLKI